MRLLFAVLILASAALPAVGQTTRPATADLEKADVRAPAGKLPPTQPVVAGSRWKDKAAQAGLSPLAKSAFEQIAQLPLCNLRQIMIPGSFDIMSPSPGSPDATVQLYRMGLDVVPLLAEALDDTTLTKTVTVSGAGDTMQHQVNELVAVIIYRLCDRTFAIGDESDENAFTILQIRRHPESAPAFREAINKWYEANRGRSYVERKIADVDDSWFRNRLDAVESLGRISAHQASPAIVKYIERTLRRRETSLIEAELSEAAFALGQIGDKESLPAVKRACEHMAEWALSQGVGYIPPHDLFACYRGLALLGERDKAIKDLRSIYESQKGKMEGSTRAEFESLLESATHW